MNLKKWLLQCIALADIFKNRNQPYIFALGFDNLIYSFKKIKYSNGFIDITDTCKNLLDFDNQPDDYILSKIKIIQNLIEQASQLNWLNFDGPSFYEMSIDVADDLAHPGQLTNKLMYEKFVTYIDQNKLL
jgi:hypothetical protein